MKRNLISIVILALLIVNIVLTAIMMFSVVSTNKKTAALVTDITSAIHLDLESEQGVKETVPMEDTMTYTIADMTIPLKKSEAAEGGEGDNKEHFALLSLTLSMNSKHEDYKSYGEDMTSRERSSRWSAIIPRKNFRQTQRRSVRIFLRRFKSYLILILSLM